MGDSNNNASVELSPSVKELQNHLALLRKKYFSPVAQLDLVQWPSHQEIDHLLKLVGVLDTGKPVMGFILRTRFNRVNRCYHTLKLNQFVEKALRKVEALPLGPITRIRQHLHISGVSQENRQILEALFPINWRVEQAFSSTTFRDWEKAYFALKEFTSQEFQTLAAKRSTTDQFDHSTAVTVLQRVLGWSAYLDVIWQYQCWQKWYGATQHTVQLLQCLANPTIDARLRKVLYGDAPDPNVLRNMREKHLAAKRKRKSRRKKAQKA